MNSQDFGEGHLKQGSDLLTFHFKYIKYMNMWHKQISPTMNNDWDTEIIFDQLKLKLCNRFWLTRSHKYIMLYLKTKASIWIIHHIVAAAQSGSANFTILLSQWTFD